MNEKYLQDEDVVHFKIGSRFGINDEIILPLSLVEDLKEHMKPFEDSVKYPLNSMIFNALCVYMDYINCELIPFDDSIKQMIVEQTERDMQEMVME